MTEIRYKIASLTCCYNRKAKTAAFLTSLFAQPLPEGFTLDVYLLDDRSSDGTAAYVRKHFPKVRLVEGTGSLFWAGGMRWVWTEALKADHYDFYLLLNDDVELAPESIVRLLDAQRRSGEEAQVILGSVIDRERQKMTYGGHKLTNKIFGDSKPVYPDEKELQACELGNANIMLVDKGTVNRIGILSSDYTHGLADFDYTLRAVRDHIKVWVAPGFYGYCPNDHGVPWVSGKRPLKERLLYLYRPTGLAYKEYLAFKWRHFPLAVPGKFVRLWVKTLFPVFYEKFKRYE